MIHKVPYRILASYTRKNGKHVTAWFYLEGTRFRTYGMFSGSIKPSALTVIPHEHNDKESIAIIEESK